MVMADEKKLRRLYQVLTTKPAPAASLAQTAALAPEEIVPAINELRRRGAFVAGDEVTGYYRYLPPPLNAQAIAEKVKGEIGTDLRVHDTLASTMEEARTLKPARHGTAVFAERQTAGRGRAGRSWASPARLGLYVSVILHRDRIPPPLTVLPLTTGVAVRDACADAVGRTPTLKWPNDLLYDNAKVAGILIESNPDVIIAGIGVNVFHSPFDLPDILLYPATSLAAVSGTPPDRNALAAAILNWLSVWLDRWRVEGPAAVLDSWRENTVTLGHRVRVAGGEVTGKAVGITPEGALVVVTDAGEERVIYAGDVMPDSL